MREPFLLFMHFNDTHTPYDPPLHYTRAFDHFSTEHNQKLDSFLESMQDRFLRSFMTKWTYGADQTDEIVRRYLGSVRYLDDQIGRLLSGLASRGFLDNAILAMTTDHGEAMGEHGDYFTHSTIYNEIMRVPLIVNFPGGEGKRVAAACQLTDIMPTIVDLLGIETDLSFDGSSLLPLFKGEDGRGPGDRDIFLAQPIIWTCRPARVGIVRGRHKYIGCPDRSPECRQCGLVHHEEPELYDLTDDPGETNNIAETEKLKAEELKAALSGFGW
jgi:arylsulfatase A-like enzyme